MLSLTKIGVLGGKGMLGGDLVRFLSGQFSVDAIDKDNYDEYKRREYDVLINANGNSKRFWANQNPLADFEASTVSVAKSLFDFGYKKYIYISSPDTYEDLTSPATTREDSPGRMSVLSPYGLHKRLSEELVRRYASDFIILRSSAILGTQLKKGIVCDVLQDQELFVTLDSKIQFITTQVLSEIIAVLLSKNASRDVFNVGGRGTVTPEIIAAASGKQLKIRDGAERQCYEMNVGKIAAMYGELKTSEDYIRLFIEQQLG